MLSTRWLVYYETGNVCVGSHRCSCSIPQSGPVQPSGAGLGPGAAPAKGEQLLWFDDVTTLTEHVGLPVIRKH